MMLRNSLKLSRNMSNIIAAQNRTSSLSAKFASEFKDFYPKLIDKAISQTPYLPTSEIRERLKKLALYYPLEKVPLQGELTVYAYELLENSENINDDFKHQLFTVASLIETLQQYFYLIDDVTDRCQTRCGKPCWHLLPEVQSLAMNDISLLRGFIDVIIRQNIDDHFRLKVQDVFDEVYFITDVGQNLDEVMTRTRNYANYTRGYYYTTMHGKTSRYAVISNLHLGLIFANKFNKETKHLVEDLCKDLGVMIQVHNDLTDYIDLDGKIANKTSSDIPNGKCTWLSVTALEHFTPAQRKVFEKCYGSRDSEDVNRIRELYADLDVLRLYHLEKQTHFDVFLRKVHNLAAESIPSTDFFIKILDFFNGYLSDTTRYFYI